MRHCKKSEIVHYKFYKASLKEMYQEINVKSDQINHTYHAHDSERIYLVDVWVAILDYFVCFS